LFFECLVAKAVWYYVNDFLNMTIGSDYISIASKWLSRDKYYVANTISAAVLRGIWLIRNEFVFHNQVWADVKMVLRKVLTLIVKWRPIYKATKVETMERVYFSGAKAEGTTHDHQWLKGYVAGKLEARLGMQTSQ
jgi:hypothetical protein